MAELNDEINTLKKENATLLERLEDIRKVVSTYLFNFSLLRECMELHYSIILFCFFIYISFLSPILIL